MRRTTLLAAAAAAIALLAGCTADTGTAIGAPAGGPSITASGPAADGAQPQATTSPTATISGGKPTPLGRPSRTTPTKTAPTGTTPTTYERITLDIPQQPSGYATVSTLVPAGWTARTDATGTGWWGRTVTVDRRDRTGTLLVRLHHEPATGGSEDADLSATIDHYWSLPGAVVTVTRPPYRAANGLRAAAWTVDVPVAGQRRTAYVSALVLNGRVVTVYTSAPHGAGTTARALYDHAADLTIRTHIGTEAG